MTARPGLLPDRLTPDSPLWAWAYDAITHRVDGMLEHLEGVRSGADIEAVHDMRVGSRRLVAAMRVFRSCFPGAEYARLLREARRVTRRLGAVRDLDVLLEHYERLTVTAGADERPGIDYLLRDYGRRRDRERPPMLEALKALTASVFVGRLRRYLREEAETWAVGLRPARSDGGARDLVAASVAVATAAGVFTLPPRPEGSDPFRRVAALLLAERHQAFYAFAPYVARPEAVEQLHAMRIAAKWFRYTMELFAPAYADGLKRELSAVKRMQELLGDLHDSDVRLDLLRRRLGEPLAPHLLEMGTPAESIIAGLLRLRDREERTRRDCYEALLKEWRKLEKRGFRDAALRRIEEADG